VEQYVCSRIVGSVSYNYKYCNSADVGLVQNGHDDDHHHLNKILIVLAII
jgi:hypothetical protein